MGTPIYVSTGAARYVGGTVTETTGKDITLATFLVGLGSISTPPTVWVAPSVNVQGATVAVRILKLLVTNTTPAGTYYCWAKITDTPEVEPLILQGPIVVI
ncbi:hypothetical protein [Cryobacterium fucosi]|uniref:Uncharacterized protein n=1 Tax=Cryobacterium fucosi TaxID=1259157 RepID=A0A4R9B534_9MICO|nr:hypothetical protein [Cryobacterium fucosi]TFD74747.1 hypothetical protein E3T48_12540 [Cryobacterium fucosi]